MNLARIRFYLCLVANMYALNGCGLLDLSPTTTAKGKVVKYRTKKPISGVSVYAYERRFDCGAVCNTYHLTGDSTLTDAEGNFTLHVSQPDLLLSVYKRGYFGIFPGQSTLPDDRIRSGKNDFGTIPLKSYGAVDLTLVNKSNLSDSISYRLYSCGEEVNTGYETFERVWSGFTIKWSVEAECTVDLYVNARKNGQKRILLKESFYLNQNEVKKKTFEF